MFVFCLCKREADTWRPLCHLLGIWTDRHAHSIPPRCRNGQKRSRKSQLAPSGSKRQVFSTHALEPDGQCTCLVSVHVSFQARKPDLRLQAGVKKISPCYYTRRWVCVCVCTLPEPEKSAGSLTLVDSENKLGAVLQEGR